MLLSFQAPLFASHPGAQGASWCLGTFTGGGSCKDSALHSVRPHRMSCCLPACPAVGGGLRATGAPPAPGLLGGQLGPHRVGCQRPACQGGRVPQCAEGGGGRGARPLGAALPACPFSWPCLDAAAAFVAGWLVAGLSWRKVRPVAATACSAMRTMQASPQRMRSLLPCIA